MDSNKKNIGEKKSVQPPGREGASGQQKETMFVRTAPKKESPLEERRVVRKPEEPAKPLPQESAKELDWPLLKRVDRDVKDVEPQQEAYPAKAGGRRQLTKSEERLRSFGRVGQWFQILCFMHIPVFGFFYMLVTAIRKKTPPQKKSFAIAYILYRILVLFLAAVILFILYKVGLSFVEEILRYAHF